MTGPSETSTDSHAATDAPLHHLRRLERLARRHAVGLPREKEAGELWHGIGFRIADRHVVVAVDEIRELIDYPRLTRIPATKRWVKGIANVRGHLLSVVDLRDYLNGEQTVIRPRSRVLALREEAHPVGLLVDEVLGIRHFIQDSQVPCPAGEPDWLAPYLRGVFREASGEEWGFFDVAGLVHRPEFSHAAL